MLAVLEHGYPVDQHVNDPGRVLMRFLKRGVVTHRFGVKDHHVGEIIRLQSASSLEFEVLGR